MNNIKSLEFDDIKNSFKTFLQQDPFYSDFNFEASNISRLLNILGYDTTYNGYYIKMLLDESFHDSAHTKGALVSHANIHNYLVKGVGASKALVKLSVNVADTEGVPYITCPYGTQFTAMGANGKQYMFVTMEDVVLIKNGNTYTSDNFIIQQGSIEVLTYEVVKKNQKYLVTDINCDEATIKIKIKPSIESRSFLEYLRNYDRYNVKSFDRVYSVTSNTSGLYQIHFGQDVFGREPQLSEIIEITYLRTDATLANDARNFKIILGKNASTPKNSINFYENVVVTTIDSANGASEPQEIEDIRYAITNHSRVQSRVITAEDIKSVLMSEFRDIDSISVWGGERADVRQYGKVFISIKPKSGDYLTNTAKTIIEDLLTNRYGVVAKSNVVFVEPYFTDINFNLIFKINAAKTNEPMHTIIARLNSKIQMYNDNVLSKFDTNYSDSDILAYLKDGEYAITSIFTDNSISKVIQLNHGVRKYNINFGNPIKDLVSDEFTYGNLTCTIINEDDKLFIIDSSNKRIVDAGTIDKETGRVVLLLPKDVTSKLLRVTTNAAYPDIETYQDSIVRIKTINVTNI